MIGIVGPSSTRKGTNVLSRRTSIRAGIAVLGVTGALGLSTPAFATDEGDHIITTANCQADEKIELRLVNGAYHDVMAIDPLKTNGACHFIMDDEEPPYRQYDSTSGAESPWFDDGPGHYIVPYIRDTTFGQVVYGVEN